MRALESFRPDEAWFQRLVRTPVDALLGSMREYCKGFETIESLYEFEDGLESDKADILDLIESLLSDPGITGFLRTGYDFDNMLHLWKAVLLGGKPFMNRFGIVPVEEIEQAVKSSVVTGLPGYMKKFYSMLQAFGESGDPGEIEYAGENAKWEYLLEAAPSRDARFYTMCRIDLANIKTFIRLKRTILRTGNSGRVWIDGGDIDRPTLVRLFKEPEDELHTYLAVTGYRGLVRKGFDTGTPMWKIEAVLNSCLLDLIGESRYRFFDIMPVIYHLELRERESRLLRIIITGKINNFPDEKIQEKVEAVLS